MFFFSSVALNYLLCSDVPLRYYVLTHSFMRSSSENQSIEKHVSSSVTELKFCYICGNPSVL